MSHRIDKKIEARFASGFCHGYKVSVSSNENYLINKPLMRERGNIESYSHINARLLKANKRIVIFLKIETRSSPLNSFFNDSCLRL